MKVVVDGKTYEFEQEKLLYSEIAFIQKRTGLKLQDWQQGLAEMDAFALGGLVYILRKRAGEQPDWDTLDFDVASLEIVGEETDGEPAPKEDAPSGAGAVT